MRCSEKYMKWMQQVHMTYSAELADLKDFSLDASVVKSVRGEIDQVGEALTAIEKFDCTPAGGDLIAHTHKRLDLLLPLTNTTFHKWPVFAECRAQAECKLEQSCTEAITALKSISRPWGKDTIGATVTPLINTFMNFKCKGGIPGYLSELPHEVLDGLVEDPLKILKANMHKWWEAPGYCNFCLVHACIL